MHQLIAVGSLCRVNVPSGNVWCYDGPEREYASLLAQPFPSVHTVGTLYVLDLVIVLDIVPGKKRMRVLAQHGTCWVMRDYLEPYDYGRFITLRGR